MILNIVILIFLVLMIAIWAHYGLFSALLHLLAVVVAGALALALWEPMVFSVQLSRPNTIGIEYAWGAWLLGLFVVLLIVIRVLMDKIVRGNVQFSYLTNVIGGGALGLFGGILTAGLTLLGVSLLPLPVSILGYQPLELKADGTIVPYGQLWVPVDRFSANFFTRLSGGSFWGGRPMSRYMPDPVQQANLFRLNVDPQASLTSVSQAVTLGKTYARQLPLSTSKLDPMVARAIEQNTPAGGASMLMLVELTLDLYHPPYDKDNIVRIPPSQVRLVAFSAEVDGDTSLLAPIGFVDQQTDGRREFVVINKAEVLAHSALQKKTFTWVFVVPSDSLPAYLLFRRLRLEFPAGQGTVGATEEEMIAALGHGRLGQTPVSEVVPDSTTAGTGQFGGRTGVRANAWPVGTVEITNKLPDFTSMNLSNVLTFQGNEILEGEDEVSPPTSSVSNAMRVEAFAIPAGTVSVRIQLEPEHMNQYLGAARVLASRLGGIYLFDTSGGSTAPYAYVLRKASRVQYIYRKELLRSASQLPVGNMEAGDSLYVYFQLPSEVSITSMKIGDAEFQLDMPMRLVNPAPSP